KTSVGSIDGAPFDESMFEFDQDQFGGGGGSFKAADLLTGSAASGANSHHHQLMLSSVLAAAESDLYYDYSAEQSLPQFSPKESPYVIGDANHHGADRDEYQELVPQVKQSPPLPHTATAF